MTSAPPIRLITPTRSSVRTDRAVWRSPLRRTMARRLQVEHIYFAQNLIWGLAFNILSASVVNNRQSRLDGETRLFPDANGRTDASDSTQRRQIDYPLFQNLVQFGCSRFNAHSRYMRARTLIGIGETTNDSPFIPLYLFCFVSLRSMQPSWTLSRHFSSTGPCASSRRACRTRRVSPPSTAN